MRLGIVIMLSYTIVDFYLFYKRAVDKKSVYCPSDTRVTVKAGGTIVFL